MSVTYSIISPLWKTVKYMAVIYVPYVTKTVGLQSINEGLVVYGRSCYNTLAKITRKLTLFPHKNTTI